MTSTTPSLTIGIKGEYQSGDPSTLELCSGAQRFLDREEAIRPAQMHPEFLQSQIEISIPVCRDIQEARRALVRARRAMRDLARQEGMLLAAAGTHPFSSWAAQTVSSLGAYPSLSHSLQDVGRRLGGVFREAATLAEKHGDDRVFNTPIQEAFIIGSCAGLSAVGVKPIVEIQFMDYIFPGVNQLISELAKSHYLTKGKYPVQAVIRVPAGAYGGGGPYHSGTHETVIAGIKGVKIVYPSNAADMKGLLKAAFLDPNPVVFIEHKGLYWSKVPGTEGAKTPEPSRDYIIPLGKARIALEADPSAIEQGNSAVVITYGMGVWWATNAAKEQFPGQVEVVDLRTLVPMDEELVYERVRRHSKALVVAEEAGFLSLAEAIAGRIQQNCFEHLDAPVRVVTTPMIPAIPLNEGLEKFVLPGKERVARALSELLAW